ncbi:glycosyltransferase [Christensenellaceae bacterium]|nr:glycosyltransferase [Christensenellaceae bacterium]BDF62123.1 glycosyltransferase [Christensenellaceae bacterium]
MVKLSVVVPIFNEEENIVALHQEIDEVCRKENYEYEIIFVDDGSTDSTYELAKQLKPLKYIRMRRNFGQTAAMDAGIKAAQNDYIITMDGDRQNDPTDIPRLIAFAREKEPDVVSGWRKNRKDTLMKKFTSRGANLLRGMIVKDHIHDSGCSLKLYKKECFQKVNLYGEMHRFIPALLEIKGFSVGEIIVNHRPRTAGKTKYNWKRTFKGFVDMISVWFWNRFAVRPLHLLGGMGIVSFLIGLLFGIWSIILFIMGANLSGYMQPILTVFFIVIGVLLFVFGLMADMLTKIYYGSKIDDSYSIKDVFEQKD